MISYKQLKSIHKCKIQGRNINQTAKRTGISYPTVKKYWTLELEEFLELQERDQTVKRKSKCDAYRNDILRLLKEVPERSSSNIYDQLLKKYREKFILSERTIRSYIFKLRKEEGIPKTEKKERDFQAVEDLQPGQQMQVDFGEIKVRKKGDPSKRIKLTFILFTLKYSRYKYVEWKTGSFNTEKAVQAHLNAFEYFGGIPKEAVYDQDTLFVKKESKGYVEFTRGFGSFLEAMPFKAIVANKADPQTKGSVERYVAFVKKNFAYGKLFTTLDEWNADCIDWLERTGNGKICQATNKKPAELFKQEEQQALNQLTQSQKDFRLNSILPYKVNKDNTVSFGKSRYRVPNGYYNKYPDHLVHLQKNGDHILLIDPNTGEILANYLINTGKPGIIGDKEVKRTTKEEWDFLISFCAELIDYPNGFDFIKAIYLNYPRHYIQQLKELRKVLQQNKNLKKETVQKAFKLCLKNDYNAVQQFQEVLEICAKKSRELSFEFSELEEKVKSLKPNLLEEFSLLSNIVFQEKNKTSVEKLEALNDWIDQALYSENSDDLNDHERKNLKRLEELNKLTQDVNHKNDE